MAAGRVRVPAAAAAGEIRAQRGSGVIGEASEPGRASLGGALRGVSRALAARRGKLPSARCSVLGGVKPRGGVARRSLIHPVPVLVGKGVQMEIAV